MSDDDKQKELEALYASAAEDEVFFVEYEGMPAAAGDMRDLVALAEGNATDPQEMRDELVKGFMGAIVDLCVLGKVKGEDRIANCQSAWDAFKAQRDQGVYPRMVTVRQKLGLPVNETKRLGTF